MPRDFPDAGQLRNGLVVAADSMEQEKSHVPPAPGPLSMSKPQTLAVSLGGEQGRAGWELPLFQMENDEIWAGRRTFPGSGVCC